MAPPNQRLQRTGGTAGGLCFVGVVVGRWRFPRPPLNRQPCGVQVVGQWRSGRQPSEGPQTSRRPAGHWRKGRQESKMIALFGSWRIMLGVSLRVEMSAPDHEHL
jgi:hypothetical protein